MTVDLSIRLAMATAGICTAAFFAWMAWRCGKTRRRGRNARQFSEQWAAGNPRGMPGTQRHGGGSSFAQSSPRQDDSSPGFMPSMHWQHPAEVPASSIHAEPERHSFSSGGGGDFGGGGASASWECGSSGNGDYSSGSSDCSSGNSSSYSD